MSRIYEALRRAEREGQNLIQRTQIGPVILEQSKTETREPRILQESIIQKFQSQESSLSQRFEAKLLCFKERVVGCCFRS